VVGKVRLKLGQSIPLNSLSSSSSSSSSSVSKGEKGEDGRQKKNEREMRRGRILRTNNGSEYEGESKKRETPDLNTLT